MNLFMKWPISNLLSEFATLLQLVLCDSPEHLQGGFFFCFVGAQCGGYISPSLTVFSDI